MAVAVPTRFRSDRIPVDLAYRSDDDGLAARVRAGDDTAFDTIYERYHRKLLAFCRHMVGSREEAEDVLQHTFVSAYRALRRTDEPVALRPWLYTIARNRCLSTLRARTPETDLEGAESELRSFDGLAAEVHRRSELRDLVHDIKLLPEEQRAALVLFELGDHSHEEIAHVLGVRREKVKALVFQAREGLMRARRGREASCHEIREQLATTRGAASKRSLERLHVDRCPACSAYEADVRRQRVAIAAVLPVLPSVGLKSSVLGSILGGGGLAAAGGGAAGGGTAVVTAGGAGASAGGAGMATTGALGGGATAAGAGASASAAAAGAAGAAAGTAAVGTAAVGTTAGGLAAAGAGAGVVAAEVGTAGGLAGGLAGLGVQGIVAKVLTVVAVAGGAGGATAHEISERRDSKPKAAEVAQQSAAPGARAAPGPTAPAPLGGLGIGALAPMPPANLTPVVFEAPPLPAAAPDAPVPAEPGRSPSLPPAAEQPPAAADPGTTTEPGPNVAEPIIPFDGSGEESTQSAAGEGTSTEPEATGPVPESAPGATTLVVPVTPTEPTPTEPTPTDPVTTPPAAEEPPGPGTTPPDPGTQPGTNPTPTDPSPADTPKGGASNDPSADSGVRPTESPSSTG